MRIIAFIEEERLIEKVLQYPSLQNLKVSPPAKVKAPSVTISIDDSDSQVPFSTPPFYPDPDYPMDSYVNCVVLWGTKELDCPQEGLMTRS